VKAIRFTLCIVLATGCCAVVHAQDVRIRSDVSVDTRITIAVPPFATDEPELTEMASRLARVVAADLEFSGLFVVLSPEEYPAGFTGFPADVAQMNREMWRATRAENLVYGTLHSDGDLLIGRFRLFDLFSKDQVVGQELRVQRQYPRLAAHRFSEEVIRYLNGVPGMATSEICFSAGETGHKEIYVSDYDGMNMKQVTDHDSISIKPKMSPDGNRIAYLSYKDRYSFLYIFDRRTGKSVPLSKEVGLNSAPAWSPDGSRIALTLSKDGNTEIYLRDPDGKNLMRLTNNRFGDTSPIFSPDGSKIAFVSDRGGSPQIHVMDTDGSNASRLSHQGGNSYDPSWSPDGKKIAYVVEKRGEGLEIYMMDAGGTNPQRLTDSQGSNESPSWSPDSRHVIFMSTRDGVARLYTVTVENGETRTVPNIELRSEGPYWGPRRR
jgi:TolB protein